MIQFIKDHPKSNTHRIMRYDELHDLAQYVKEKDGTLAHYGTSSSYLNRQGSSRWIGRKLESIDHIIQLLREPWPEGERIADQMYDEMMTKLPQPKTIKRKRRWSDDTGEVDCDRIMRGEAEYMQQIYKNNENSESTNIALLLDLNGSCGMSSDSIFWRGAASAALVDHLEAAGYSCEIWVYSNSYESFRRSPCDNFEYRKIKSAGESFDRQKLIVGTSTWVMRGLLFLYYLTFSDVSHDLGRVAYGYSQFRDLFDIDPSIKVVSFNGQIRDANCAVEEAKRIMCEVTGAVPEHA